MELFAQRNRQTDCIPYRSKGPACAQALGRRRLSDAAADGALVITLEAAFFISRVCF